MAVERKGPEAKSLQGLFILLRDDISKYCFLETSHLFFIVGVNASGRWFCDISDVSRKLDLIIIGLTQTIDVVESDNGVLKPFI